MPGSFLQFTRESVTTERDEDPLPKKTRKSRVFYLFVFTSCLIHSTSLISVSLTQTDLLPRVGGQKKDQQGHGGQQHTWDEEVQGVEQGPPTQSHHKGHVWVGLGAAVVKDFMATTGDLWRTGGNHHRGKNKKETQLGILIIFSCDYLDHGSNSNSGL